jgi:pimeloyl-ACP methyl ester carboxylesterase
MQSGLDSLRLWQGLEYFANTLAESKAFIQSMTAISVEPVARWSNIHEKGDSNEMTVAASSTTAITPTLSKEDSVPPQLYSMQSTEVFGQIIRYYDVGAGDVLILLHGIASTAFLDWGKLIEPLAANHRVLAMDQIGFGSSDKPGIEFRIQTFVDFLGEFLRQNEVERFSLAGVSFGGWVAAQYAIQALRPNNAAKPADKLPPPNKLLLCDAAGLLQDVSPDVLIAMSLPGSVAAQKASLEALVYDQSLANDEAARQAFISRLAANDGLTIRSLADSLPTSSEWVNDKLHAITIPTLVVWGAEDHIMPLAHGREFAASIPGAKLIVIEKCGHAPMVERPTDFLSLIKDFL